MYELFPNNLSHCPRCECASFEHLATHGYCTTCNYSPDIDQYRPYDVPQWALRAIV